MRSADRVRRCLLLGVDGTTINRRGQAVACLQAPAADFPQDPEANYRRGQAVGGPQDPVADFRRGLEVGCQLAPVAGFQRVLAEGVRLVRPANVLMGRKES
jgi:hypothetical protein